MTTPKNKTNNNCTRANDSSTEVNYPQNVFSGVRKTKGFKCDTGLYAAFKPVAEAYFGSVCKPLECFMLAVLALQKERVNFGTTVTIQNLNITRDLRTRRKIVVDKCGFKDCINPAVAEAIWRDKKIFPLCEKHLQEAKEDSKTWRII
jgi:hypothetical protein